MSLTGFITCVNFEDDKFPLYMEYLMLFMRLFFDMRNKFISKRKV